MVGKKLSIQFPNLAEGDTEIEHDDYEAQRQANIKANQELLLSLGLFSASVLFTPTKPLNSSFSSPTPKSKSKSHLVRSKSSFASINAGSGGRGDVKSSIALNRPKRITRSVSRTLDPSSPLTSTGRRMKRALSDDELYPIQRRSSRRDSYISSFSDDEDQDDKEHSTSRTKKFRRHTSSLFLSHQQRKHVSSHLLQRSADRLGVRIQNPKTFGSIPGIPVGTLWEKRMDCSTDAIHAPTVAGISGNADVGCWSICLSGGYEDDVDLGETFTYTGSGGRDLKGTKQNPKNLRTAPQSKDQTFDGVNGALKKSVETKRPIRVVRGYKGNNMYSPNEGYVYCGLYRAKRAWMERGRAGFMVCKFEFQRLARQAPLPTFNHVQEDGEEVASTRAMRAEKRSTSTLTTTTTITKIDSDSTITTSTTQTSMTTTINLTQEDDDNLDLQSSGAADKVRRQTRDASYLSSPSPSPSPSPPASASALVSPAPSKTNLISCPRHRRFRRTFPILTLPNNQGDGFDRAQYIFIGDTDDDDDDDDDQEEDEVLLQLELE